MKKLTAVQCKARDEYAIAVRTAIDDVNTKIAAYNEALTKAKDDVEASIVALNEKLDEARGWRDSIVSDMDSYVSDRSEKWSESDAASTYEDWKQEFENLEIEDVELELPEELEMLEEDAADAIDNLPESPG